jgi:hypothetical protein
MITLVSGVAAACASDWSGMYHGAHCGEGPVLAMLARKGALYVAPLLPSPPLRAAAPAAPGRDGKAGWPIEQEADLTRLTK